MFGEIKWVNVHQMMNGISRHSNNCFIALLKTMGDCDLRAGKQSGSTTNACSGLLFHFSFT